jgi:hypothetical protein
MEFWKFNKHAKITTFKKLKVRQKLGTIHGFRHNFYIGALISCEYQLKIQISASIFNTQNLEIYEIWKS